MIIILSFRPWPPRVWTAQRIKRTLQEPIRTFRLISSLPLRSGDLFRGTRTRQMGVVDPEVRIVSIVRFEIKPDKLSAGLIVENLKSHRLSTKTRRAQWKSPFDRIRGRGFSVDIRTKMYKVDSMRTRSRT